jgi:hypothetical protein
MWEQYSAFCWAEYCELVIESALNEQYKIYTLHVTNRTNDYWITLRIT